MSSHTLPLGRAVVESRHVALQQVNAVLLDALCLRANLNALVRLSGATLNLRLAVFAWNKQDDWHSDACCVLQVNICAVTPMDTLNDYDDLAVGKSHLERIDELLLGKRRISETERREETKGIP